MTAACQDAMETPVEDNYLVPSSDGQLPVDGSLTTNDMRRRVVTNAAKGRQAPAPHAERPVEAVGREAAGYGVERERHP